MWRRASSVGGPSAASGDTPSLGLEASSADLSILTGLGTFLAVRDKSRCWPPAIICGTNTVDPATKNLLYRADPKQSGSDRVRCQRPRGSRVDEQVNRAHGRMGDPGARLAFP